MTHTAMNKPQRKNPPRRGGDRITFQIENDVKAAIIARADVEFSSVPKKGRMSALVRKAVELYLAEQLAGRTGGNTPRAK